MAAITTLAIVGPTASGKTALAIEIAERWNAEIICADSRTIYKGMDIGTAKPTLEEQARVRHWGIDIVHPGETFNVADFKQYAENVIKDIQGRHKNVIIVGGTGLYIDSVLYDFQFNVKADVAQRSNLSAMTLEELHLYCSEHNITLPENDKNKRYVIRAIERGDGANSSKSTLKAQSYIVGIATNRQVLRRRIKQRAEMIFDDEIFTEAYKLAEQYGWESEAMTGNIYPIVRQMIEGGITTEVAKEKFITSDYQLAKRQMTWFRRNSDVMWCRRNEVLSHLGGVLAGE